MFLRDTLDWLLCRRVVEDAGRRITLSAADYMAQRAMQHVPVDTGLLMSTIAVVSPSGSTQAHVVVTADYAPYVEFGHMTVAGSWVPPNPFLRNALADTVAAFPSIVESVQLRRPEYMGNESEGLVGSDVQYLGVSFNK